MKRLLFFLLVFPSIMLAQNTLEVSVDGVESSSGEIRVALYNQEEGFLEFDKVFESASAPAKKGNTKLSIENIPKGRYALALFHDENGNTEMDTNFMGVPKEPVGFSNAKMKTFGPPSFEECAFEITTDQEIKVSL